MVQAPESAGRAVVFFPCERDDVLAVRAMSFEEFISLDFEGKIAEWVDGEARIYVNATDHHQRVVIFLSSLLHTYCDATGAGIVRTAPYAIRTHPGANSREPDVIFVAEAHRDRLGEQYLEGPPDIAVEVVSPDSVRRDYEEKMADYSQGGVPEYWIIDPRPGHERADFYTLEGGRYEPLPIEAGVVESLQLPGVKLRIEWLWDPNASSLAALRELLGRDPLA